LSVGDVPGFVLARPFSLDTVFADAVMAGVFSEAATVRAWFEVEGALAQCQGELGLIPAEVASRIERAAQTISVDGDALWRGMRNVGYPILPTVQALCEILDPVDAAWVHFGATTQDIMDTGLALQIRAAIARNVSLLEELGDAVGALIDRYGDAVMAARTHALHAVPTTFGAKLAVYLTEAQELLTVLRAAEQAACAVSLFGAGGTAAGFGAPAGELRDALADRLGLRRRHVSWHSSRVGIVQFGFACALVAQLAGRMATEVINLSRTEIGELSEAKGHFRGASSTMPQKSNPILCEAAVGASTVAGSLLPALHASAQPSHERAAGEWHVEWFVVPTLALQAATSLALMATVMKDLVVDCDRMRANLEHDGGLILTEAYMFAYAEDVGREEAHRQLYSTALRTRERGTTLSEEVRASLPGLAKRLEEEGRFPLKPEDYLGEARIVAALAVDKWRQRESAGS